MIIPHDELSDDALEGVLTEIVTRDGTELSDASPKTVSVRKGLASGRLVLVLDPREGLCSVARAVDAVGPEGEDLTVGDEEDNEPPPEGDTDRVR